MHSPATYFFELLLSGLASGSLYALIALGFVLIYKGTGIMNFAQGEVIMVPALLAFFLITRFGLSVWAACLIAVASAFLLGLLTERLILRPMLGEPVFSVVMVTIGLSIFLRGVAGIFFGHENKVFPSPFPAEPLRMGPVVLSHTQLWTMAVAFGLMLLFLLFFRTSRVGLAMRATANDQHTACLMGISIERVFALTWGLSFAIAGLAGIFLANVMVLNVGLTAAAVSAFPAVVLGGLESIPGAILGGLAIGVIENLAGGYLDEMLGGGVKDVTPFVVLFLILMVRPYGLFGQKEVERV
ncbi:MAG: branched-chain amino acid ABC transporter permease [Deltaproteobacteria bacterium]|nr:branched-chain amino acid ABC transporter permease [Deltaproteobacteria bacterium]